MQATGIATDPLGLSDTDVETLASPSGTTLRTVRSSFLANRINWGNSITENQHGPESTPDPYNHLSGPRTFGFTVTAIADCRTTGMRVMKMPAGAGAVTFLCWDAGGSVIASVTDTWIADGGGWWEVEWPAPVELTADQVYTFGYHYAAANTDYAYSVYVWNNGQDTCVYPLLVLGSQGPSWFVNGASPTFNSVTAERNYHAAYIDPVMEWDVNVPGYESGNEYFDQFPNGGSRFDFPIGVYWADAPAHAAYKALGINTIWAGSYEQPGYADAIVAADLDWWPSLHDNDLSTPQAVQENSALAECVRGYFLTDEPDWITPFHSPAAIRVWRNDCRRIDSTRPIMLNLSRIAQENQGFVWQPPSITAKNFQLQLRDYMKLVDQGSLDIYGICRTFPFTYSGSDSQRYGIWIYPLVIHRMRTEITDGRIPIWGIVETTSAYPDEPTPEQVKRAVWASLIPGARGIEYFDHRFASAGVSQDFNAMTHDSVMGDAVSELNEQMQDLADALLADEANYIVSYTSTGELARAQGGYPEGATIPMHYSSRVVGGTTYFFCQSIRDGETTATFYVPGFEDAVLTVIGESRTVTIDEDGLFTDDFVDGDYEYHLYSTTATPSFSAPTNDVAPAITTDGTPETGETITCSSGTWTGVPAPTFTYQWQRASVNISGATSAAYVLQEADEGLAIRCVVTATNSQGNASANSGTVTPSAPAGSDYAAVIAADTPAAWWRLKDFTEEINGHDATETVSGVSNTASLVDDPADGAQLFDNSATARLTVTDHADLRVGLGSFSVEVWYTPAYVGTLNLVTKKGDFRLNTSGSVTRFSPHGASDWYTNADTVTANSVGVLTHIVGVWDFATKHVKIYRNGVLEGDTDASTYGYAVTTSGWGNLYMGSGADVVAGYNPASGWEGGLDEVALYDYALSDAQILAHYEAGIGS